MEKIRRLWKFAFARWQWFVLAFVVAIFAFSLLFPVQTGAFVNALTIIAFAITIWQLIETKKIAQRAESAAEAANNAVKETSRKYAKHFFAFSIGESKQLFQLASKYIHDKKFKPGADFLSLVVDQLNHLAKTQTEEGKREIEQLAEYLRQISQDGQLVDGKVITQSAFFEKWKEGSRQFLNITTRHIGPLCVEE